MSILKHYKQNYVYVGVDLHKGSHTAVVIDCWNEKLTEITVENKPSAFQKLIDHVNEYTDGLKTVYGLEDVGGNGRSLAVFLLEKGEWVKEVNSALSHAQRKSYPTTQKSDSWDAYCIACVLLAQLFKLPDAKPQDLYWTLDMLVNRRNSMVKASGALVNQLHTQLSHHYPSYKKFFSDVDGKTALAFWEQYPSPHLLQNVSLDELTIFLRKASRNSCSTRKATEILDLVGKDGDTKRAYQETRDSIVKSIVRDIKFKKQEIEQVEKDLENVLKLFGYKL